MNSLSKDIITYSLSYLPIQDVAKTSRVCKDWRELTKPESIFWKYVLANHFSRAEIPENLTSFESCQKLQRIRMNIVNGKCKTIKLDTIQKIDAEFIASSDLGNNKAIFLYRNQQFEIIDLTTNTSIYQAVFPKIFMLGTQVFKGKDGDLIFDLNHSEIVVWNCKDNKIISSVQMRFSCLAITPKDQVVVGFEDGAIQLYNKEDLSNSTDCIQPGKTTEDGISHLLVVDDGRLISASKDKVIRIWNIEKKECDLMLVDVTSPHSSRINTILFSKQREIVACRTNSIGGRVEVWDYTTGVLKIKMPLYYQQSHYHESRLLLSAAFSKDGILIVVTLESGRPTLIIKNLDQNQQWSRSPQHNSSFSLKITENGSFFYSGCVPRIEDYS